jgi:hypothetical protein
MADVAESSNGRADAKPRRTKKPRVAPPGTECEVCVTKYNKSKNKKITCTECGYSACTTCVMTFIKSKPTCYCMQCNTPYSKAFLAEFFPSRFVKITLADQESAQLFEREKELFPETMKVLEVMKQRRLLQQDISMLEQRRAAILRQIMAKRREMYAQVSFHEYKHICPDPACQGMLNGDFVCGVCDAKVCPDCHQTLSGGSAPHTCDENDLENVKFIMQNTKQCPKCHVPIHKSHGCDQMFCVSCQTRFSYNTGAIITGHFHNPEETRWVRDNRRAPGDIECGGVPSLSEFEDVADALEENYLAVAQIINNIVSAEISMIPRYVHESQPVNNQDLRIRFLTSNLDEAGFKKEALKREKKRVKCAAELEVLQVYATCGADIVRRMCVNRKSPGYIARVVEEFKELVAMCNERFLEIRRDVGARVLHLHFRDWTVSAYSV